MELASCKPLLCSRIQPFHLTTNYLYLIPYHILLSNHGNSTTTDTVLWTAMVGYDAAYNMSMRWEGECCEFRQHCLCSSHIRCHYNTNDTTHCVTHTRLFQPLTQTNISKNTLHPFNCPLSGTTRVSQYQKGKTNLDFTEARDSERQWHQLDYMQVCTLHSDR